MSDTPGAEPAYPQAETYSGFTKREVIAMHALQGWIASNPAMLDQPEHHAVAARFALNSADALLTALGKAETL